MDNDQKDNLSKFFSQAIDVFFVNNPKNTSFGVLFGIIVKQVSDLLFNMLGITIRLTYLLCLSLGIFGFNIPNFFKKHRLDESLETSMYYIKEAQKTGNFTSAEKRQQWRNFINLINERTQNYLPDNGVTKKKEEKSV